MGSNRAGEHLVSPPKLHHMSHATYVIRILRTQLQTQNGKNYEVEENKNTE